MNDRDEKQLSVFRHFFATACGHRVTVLFKVEQPG